MICRHCKRDAPNRAKGLCCICYKNKDIRDRYPSQSKFAPDHFKKMDDELTLEQLDVLIVKQRKTMIGKPKYPEAKPWTVPTIKTRNAR